MATPIKTTAEIASKWSRVTPMRTEDYEQGVQNPSRDWKTATVGGNANWKAGIAAAANGDRFKKGVEKAGTDRWQRKTLDKGTQRWGPGVQGAADDYAAGYEPYRQTIAGLTLPPRYPAGDPRNIQRVSAIATALHAKKLA